jgi:hypothetical protein
MVNYYNMINVFPFQRLASLIFVARASTPTLKTASYAGSDEPEVLNDGYYA